MHMFPTSNTQSKIYSENSSFILILFCFSLPSPIDNSISQIFSEEQNQCITYMSYYEELAHVLKSPRFYSLPAGDPGKLVLNLVWVWRLENQGRWQYTCQSERRRRWNEMSALLTQSFSSSVVQRCVSASSPAFGCIVLVHLLMRRSDVQNHLCHHPEGPSLYICSILISKSLKINMSKSKFISLLLKLPIDFFSVRVCGGGREQIMKG